MLKLKHLIFAAFSLLFFYANGQSYELGSHWSVIENADTIVNAWGGAMNSPQFAAIDLDFDGLEDLVFFDREDNSFNTYLKKVNPANNTFRYIYAPKYKNAFDKCNCKQWAIVQDFTCDGKPDILCGDIYSNVHGWKQVQINNNEIAFDNQYQPTILSEYNSTPNGKFDLFSTGLDYPSMADMDFDGDMDFMTFGNSSNYIEWHKNEAMERYGRCDTLVFKLKTYCWGHYGENTWSCGAVIHDTIGCPVQRLPHLGTDPNPTRHTGSTILTVNLDGDTLNDMIIGDISCPTVYALYNRGSRNDSYIDSVENLYPLANISVIDSIFPATFYVDVNNDNIKDFLVAPNARIGINNFEGVQYYKNMNTNDHLIPHFQSVGWLQNTNLEFGSWSAPIFFDYNSDGLQDILIANNYYATGNHSWIAWAVLKNVGTSIEPVFDLVTKDYMKWVVLNPYPMLRAMVPALEDLDSDGDKDLVLGNYDGTLYYFRNDVGASGIADFQYVTNMLDSIDVGFHSAPTFYDIDNDGDKDLFVGDKKGYLHYYKNVSVGANINFDLVTHTWGNIKIDDEIVPNTDGYPRPQFLDYNQDGKMELLVGTTYGKIRMYHNLSMNPSDTLVFIGDFFDLDFGSHATLTAAKIDSSNDWSFVVGNGRGGLQLVAKVDTSSGGSGGNGLNTLQNEIYFGLFPNPTKENIVLTFSDMDKGSKQISIINLLGQEILQTTATDDRIEISLTGMAAGFYYVKVTEKNGKLGVRKLYKE